MDIAAMADTLQTLGRAAARRSPTRMLLTAALALSLAACAVPKTGDIKSADVARTELRTLVDQRRIRVDANDVRFQGDLLHGWQVTHVPVTPELFARTPQKQRYDLIFNVYIADRAVDWQCRHSVWVPVFIRRDPAKQRFNEQDLFEFGRGDCYELVTPDKQVVAYVSVFNLSVNLETAVPPEKRQDRIWQDALKDNFYRDLDNERTDKGTWEAHGLTIAELAGYYKDSFNFLHSSLFAIRKHNYYRLVLIGRHSIVQMLVIGPSSATLGELQTQALPVIKALRYAAHGAT